MKKIFTLLLSLILSLVLVVSASAEAFAPIYGIDVSVWQGDVNWGKVANTDKEFAIIRIGYNDTQDTQFLNNYQNAKAAGIPIGGYMYSYAVTEEAAIEEANIVLERIKGMQFEYPIYIDVEDYKLLKEEYNLTNEKRTKIALAFVRTMREHGYYAGVYSTAYWFTNYLNLEEIQAECETWISHVTTSKDYSNTSFGMWQYSFTGAVEGIDGDVDLNICYKDYPTIIKNGGYNGFEKPNDNLLEPTGVKYDIDANGTCDLQDLVVLARYVANWNDLVYVESELNVNQDADGIVDLTDVVRLSQIIAGWEVELI